MNSNISNKRIRSSSPDSYKEYPMSDKESESAEKSTDLEIEINVVRYFFMTNFLCTTF
jgi:hypothetical protein